MFLMTDPRFPVASASADPAELCRDEEAAGAADQRVVVDHP
jgi:hypothetical protein